VSDADLYTMHLTIAHTAIGEAAVHRAAGAYVTAQRWLVTARKNLDAAEAVLRPQVRQTRQLRPLLRRSLKGGAA
jgi:hypothetical protein